MFELIVVLCLAGPPEKCGQVTAITNSCPGALRVLLETAPEGAVVRDLTCRRQADMELPPMDVRPEKDEKEHLKI